MLLTIFLAIVFCAAMALMLISCVVFIQDNKFFSSAPKEAREVLIFTIYKVCDMALLAAILTGIMAAILQ